MKEIPKQIREYVWRRDKGRCRYCKAPGEHIHHLYHRLSYIPAKFGIRGGENNNNPVNLILLCARCHDKVHTGKLKLDRERYVRENLEYARRWPYEEGVEVSEGA